MSKNLRDYYMKKKNARSSNSGSTSGSCQTQTTFPTFRGLLFIQVVPTCFYLCLYQNYIPFPPRASVHVESSEYDSLGRLGNRSVTLHILNLKD